MQGDHATLKSGYWWKWRNESHKRRYVEFTNNLLAPLPALGEDDVQYPYPIPTYYKCITEESCKGGLDSECASGYEGPLCGVCSSGYYKQLQTCKTCPSNKWIAGQLSIIAAVFIIIIVVSVWASKTNKKKNKERSVIDVFLAKLKVTYGLLEAFSYIKWPDSLQVIGKYSEILQLNILQMAPVHCLSPGLHVDAFGNLFSIMSLNAAAIILSGIVYGGRKILILRNRKLVEDEKTRRVSTRAPRQPLFYHLLAGHFAEMKKTSSVSSI